MLNVTNTEVFGWEAAIRGMRNPLESWEKSDSAFITSDGDYHDICGNSGPWHGSDDWEGVLIGKNDLTLMKKLIAAGSDHSKFMRMIHVQCDWEAPLYWWKEADTYKVATVRNSCSTMHKIMEHEFTIDMFAHEHLIKIDDYPQDAVYSGKYPFVDVTPYQDKSIIYSPRGVLVITIDMLNDCRMKYLSALKTEEETGLSAKEIWWQLIQLLPSSYLQKATMDLNYAVLRNMYHSRKAHKQDEWRIDFCNWVKTLPYSELITMTKEELLESIKEE